MIPVLIVPILARPELLQDMLASVDHPVRRLVVIDNGDVVRDLQVPSLVESTYVVRLPGNLGVAGSWNLGIKATPMAPGWLVANFDVTWPAGSLRQFVDRQPRDRVILSGGGWCAFAIGEQVIDLVGLFDEAYHPAYFEDDDYARRCDFHGVHVEYAGIPVHHRTSSTLKAGYDDRNSHTFTENMHYDREKKAAGNYSEGRWTLARRRRLAWD